MSLFTHECIWCGGLVNSPRKSGVKYCSKTCANGLAWAESKSKRYTPGVPRKDYEIKRRKKPCDWCGKDFMAIASPPQRYCSRACQQENQKAEKREGHYYPGISRRTHKCQTCEKTFTAAPNVANAKFCSRICSKRWYRHPVKRTEPLPQNYKYLKNGGDIRAFNREQRKAARQNAGQAWRYWLKEKAPDLWLDAYYAATGKPWRDHRLTVAEIYRTRCRHDKEFSLKERLRHHERKDKNIGRMRSAIKQKCQSPTTERMFGYTITELKQRLEALFTDGMDWDAFNRAEIHIDHIKPRSAFDTSDPAQLRACWALENLQPLWAADNIRKSNKYAEG